MCVCVYARACVCFLNSESVQEREKETVPETEGDIEQEREIIVFLLGHLVDQKLTFPNRVSFFFIVSSLTLPWGYLAILLLNPYHKCLVHYFSNSFFFPKLGIKENPCILLPMFLNS